MYVHTRTYMLRHTYMCGCTHIHTHTHTNTHTYTNLSLPTQHSPHKTPVTDLQIGTVGLAGLQFCARLVQLCLECCSRLLQAVDVRGCWPQAMLALLHHRAQPCHLVTQPARWKELFASLPVVHIPRFKSRVSPNIFYTKIMQSCLQLTRKKQKQFKHRFQLLTLDQASLFEQLDLWRNFNIKQV